MKRFLVVPSIAIAGLLSCCQQEEGERKNVHAENKSERRVDSRQKQEKSPVSSREPGDAMALIQKLQESGVDGADVPGLLARYRELLKKNPKEAAMQASTLPAGEIRSRVRTMLVSECPPAQLHEVLSVFDQEGDADIASAVSNALWMGKYTPEMAQVLLNASMGLQTEKLRNAVLDQAAQIQYSLATEAQQVREIDTMLRDLPQGLTDNDKSRFLSTYLSTMIVRDTKAASEILLTQLPNLSPEKNGELLRSTVRMLASTDNAYTDSWLQKASESYPHLSNDLYYDYTKSWLGQNVKAASLWVAQQPSGEKRDYAILGLLDYMKMKNLTEGRNEWINLISTEKAKDIAKGKVR